MNTSSKEEPKHVPYKGKVWEPSEQETLEEAAERNCISITHPYCDREKEMFFKGAKWQAERMGLMEIELNHTKTLLASCEKALKDRDKQAERMYSEGDLRKAYLSAIKTTGEGWNGEYAEGNDPNIEEKFSEGFTQWFQQFKKK
jgi:hypothetical protein